MKILDGKIFPGEGIEKYKLGMDVERIVACLNNEYVKQEREDGSCVIIIDNAKFWFNSKKKLIQIGVTGEFHGKYDGKIGIGDTLSDVQKKVGAFYEEGDDYLIKGIDGIAFELSDEVGDDWDELTAPIEWIYIYKH